MAKRRTPKRVIKRAHKIARAILRGGKRRGVNAWAVGMARAKRSARERRRR